MYSMVDWRMKTKIQHEEKMIKIMHHEEKENSIKFTEYVTSVHIVNQSSVVNRKKMEAMNLDYIKKTMVENCKMDVVEMKQ
jgi:hypothetical protein